MKTAKQLGLTKTQHKNLAKLTIFVRDKVEPPKFDITWFFQKDGSECGMDETCPSKKEYSCGTSACFAGYGILAGIEAKKEENWGDYLCRVFGLEGNEYGSLICPIYKLLFHDSHENSKKAAILRGAYFLMKGIPKADLLSKWEAPKSFIPNWPEIEKIANS